MRISSRLLFCLFLAFAHIPAAMAIVVPPAANPDIVNRYLESKENPLPPSNVQTAPVETPQPVSKELQEKLASMCFVLKRVEVVGATVYSPQQLEFAWKKQLGKQISLADAQGIVGRITDLYHKNEYILSQAIVPPQNIKDGVLTIRVIEGYISNVVLAGDLKQNRYRKILESYAENIESKRPVRTSDLERYLLLYNDLPGANAKGVVEPSATRPGTAELLITMAHKTYEESYSLDNRGSKYVGPFEHTATVAANSLFGMYDRTLLRVITTSPTTELRFADVQHEEQLDSEGTRLGLDVSHSYSRPGDALRTLDIASDSTFVQAKLTHPFVRSRKENLVGRVMFDTRDSTTDLPRGFVFQQDRLRTVRAGMSYDVADTLLGVDLIDGQISRGINIFNATSTGVDRSNAFGKSDFTKANLDLARTQPLPGNFSIFTAASGQYSADSLLAAEQFILGGVGFGEAYDPAELTGDNGMAAKIELRYGQALDNPGLNSYQFYGFYDAGRVWSRDLSPGGNDKKSLTSAGGGLRANFNEHLSGNVELAVPLTKTVANQGNHGEDPRLFFGATGRF